MVSFGIGPVPARRDSIPMQDFARWTEASGFESLWLGEHTHIPVRGGEEIPDHYKRFFDPFIGLTAAAAVTEKLVVGTGICLVTNHNPITLAKLSACLDIASNGRFKLGIGGGWVASEMANHGVDFKDRWNVVRERVLAMREIWTKDEAEFHGEHVNFDPIWAWPKPVTAGGPPVLMGASSKWVPRRVAEYCNGVLVPDSWGKSYSMDALMESLRIEMGKVGRSMDELDLSIMTIYQPDDIDKNESRVHEFIKAGFSRVVLLVTSDEENAPPRTISEQWQTYESAAKLIRRFK